MEIAEESFDEEIREFLIESNENLASLDREIVELEQNPEDPKLIASAFRAIHTIKGTSGFFGFTTLGSLTHMAENLLSDVREGRQKLTTETISLVLESVDEVKRILDAIESTGMEGEDRTADLRSRLEKSLAKNRPVARSIDGATSQARQPEQTPPIQEPHDAATETAHEARGEGSGQIADSTIRVDVGLLNGLMNLVGELVLARNQLLQETTSQSPPLQKATQRLNLITSELQEGVMKTRMQPIEVVWSKLPRVVRDLAAQCGKKIRLEMDGAGTELDRTIIEAIKDPLTHIVRNCCDHGIELPDVRTARGKKAEGLIAMRAFHEGGVVHIEISDDGAGIDPERVKAKAVERGILRAEVAAKMSTRDAVSLIFMPGFSTAAQVTSISGRGVGMDVVKSNIEKIGGNVEALPRSEGGTSIRIKIPLTLAIIPGLIVTLANTTDGVTDEEHALHTTRSEERFILPQANLLELVRVEAGEQARRIETVHGTPIFRHRGELLPLLYLARLLGRQDATAAIAEALNIVVLQVESRKIGLAVDGICDTQEIVVKPLGRQLKGLSCYAGATIMGDGRPALILDVAGLARLAGLTAQPRVIVLDEPEKGAGKGETQRLLLFKAATLSRVAVPLAMVDRLEEVETAEMQYAAGRPVLHYRGEILPLVSLEEFLGTGCTESKAGGKTMDVVVFSDGQRRMGLVVDQILDIVEEAVVAPRCSSASGLLGSALVSDRVTDMLDLRALLDAADETWFRADGLGGADRRLSEAVSL